MVNTFLLGEESLCHSWAIMLCDINGMPAWGNTNDISDFINILLIYFWNVNYKNSLWKRVNPPYILYYIIKNNSTICIEDQ